MNMDSRQNLERSLSRSLRRLAARIRAYALFDGLSLVLVAAGVAFWISLGLDWSIEWSRPIRAFLLLTAVVGLATFAYELIVRRVFARLAPPSLAALLERRFTRLNGSLLTSVEEFARPGGASQFHKSMVQASAESALSRLSQIDVGDVFRWRPLVRNVVLAVLAVGSVAAFAAWAPALGRTWLDRNLLLSANIWPRKTRLSVEGFVDGQRKIARGDDLEILVRADASMVVPNIVRLNFRAEDGGQGRENMSKQGTAAANGERFQEYTHTFRNLLSSMIFDISGGDDRLAGLSVLVVESPTVVSLTADAEYPAYTNKIAARGLAITSNTAFPEGTRLNLKGASNKNLSSVAVHSDRKIDEGSTPPVNLEEVSGRTFGYELGILNTDETVRFQLVDTDGIKGKIPLQITLRAAADEPPRVSCELTGIGTAVTPKARMPFRGRVTDDYGVSRAWIEYQIGDGQLSSLPFAPAADGKVNDVSLDVAPLDLQPGQKIMLGVKAEDNCALAKGAQAGTGQRYTLEVVTEGQLRAMLEARELILRRQLDSIIEQVSNAKDAIDRVLPQPRANSTSIGPRDRYPFAAVMQDMPPASPPPAGSSSSDMPEDPTLGRLRVQGALQAARRSSQETVDLAQAFADIRAELANNRIEVEGLNARLYDGIERPLRDVASQEFPVLVERLVELESRLADQTAASPIRDRARRQLDLIHDRLRGILAQMIELESYHELLDLLRDIIRDQDDVSRKTEDRRKQKILDLLKE